MINKLSTLLLSSVALLFAGIIISGCKKQDLKLNTTEDVNIVGYLEKNPDSFSLIKEILDRTDNSNFLNAYGSYTFFAPTNSGVKTWLAAIGAANVESADIEALKELVKFHVLPDTVTTGSFKDGKLPVPTMQGQFLITGVNFDASSSYTVNRQALVLTSNVKVGNGFIHVINNVLVPAKTTIAQQLESNPNYSIFVEAMKATGFFTLLNTVDSDTSKRWKTVLAESNKSLGDSGITSYSALKSRYSNTGDPSNVKDSLHMYMAYHILDGIKFLGDIITAPSHETLEPQEVVSTQLIDQEVKVNEDIFNGILEPGITLTRNVSDNSATNGVWHAAASHFTVKFRKPAAVYWDVADFPEIRKLPAYFRKQSYNFVRQSEADKPIKDMDWELKGPSNTLFYVAPGTGAFQDAVYNDVLRLPMGPTGRAAWWQLTTPVIIKGRYKVWICYRNIGRTPSCNVVINGETMQRPVNFQEGKPAGTPEERESIGWKAYTDNTTRPLQGRLVGTVDIKTTERHTLRFEAIPGTGSESVALDMIHFIPADQNQILPRFKPDGTPVF